MTSQDYAPGEGGALESGDSAEVKYTGWLLQNNAFGDVRSHGFLSAFVCMCVCV